MAKLAQQVTALSHPFSLLILGGEGVGKSSTINAIVGQQLAQVGDGFAAQTKQFSSYQAGCRESRFRLFV